MIAGDERAFEDFSDNYIPILYRFASRRLDRDRELTREIVQSTVCKAIAKLSTFRGEAALTTWLCACCRTEIAGYFRRKSRPIREVELPEDDITLDTPWSLASLEGPEQDLLRKEAADLVHIALDSLPAHYGRALEWKYLEGLSVKEIAGRLEVGPKAAESLLTRARLAFRDGHSRLVAGVQAAAEPVLTTGRRMVSES
jgi:RNA polymerase sigma-70 factor (ECF subfamily)